MNGSKLILDIQYNMDSVLPEDETANATSSLFSPMHPIVINLGAITGIRGFAADGKDAPVYDLQGRKVSLKDGSKKLNKGVYIVNGQKEVIK